MYTPQDYLNPDWAHVGRVHEWRRYINDEVRTLWCTIDPEIRAALARNAEDIAGREEWD